MINFDAVDFSERRPEEVISFFWRSVYISTYKHVHKTRMHTCIGIHTTDIIQTFKHTRIHI